MGREGEGVRELGFMDSMIFMNDEEFVGK